MGDVKKSRKELLAEIEQLKQELAQVRNAVKNPGNIDQNNITKSNAVTKNYLEAELYSIIKRDDTIFNFIQENILDGLWYWDLENPENEWMNKRFWNILGYNPDDMPHLASAWQHIINKDDLKIAIDNFNRHLENPNNPYDQIVRYQHNNGSTIWIRCRGIAIRNSEGKAIRMLGIHQDITAIKNNEENLIAANQQLLVNEQQLLTTNQKIITSEGLLREIAQNYPNSYVSIIEKDFTVGFAAGQEFHKQKIDPQQFIGKKLEYVFRDLTPTVKEHYEKTFKGEERNFELHINNQYQLYKTVPLRSEDGSIHRILVVVENITKRKILENKLIENNIDLKKTQELIHVGHWYWNLLTDEAVWSDELYRIFGVKKDSFDPTSKNVVKTILPEDAFKMEDAIKLLLQDGNPEPFEFRIKRPSGEIRHLKIMAIRIRKKDSDNANFIFGVTQDITMRKQAELALKINEARLSTLLSNLSGIAYKCKNDENWTMLFVSEACEQLTGYSPSQLINNKNISYENIIHPSDRKHVRQQVVKSLESGKHFEIEYRIVTASGEEKWVWEKGIQTTIAGTSRQFLEGVIYDITKHKRAEIIAEEGLKRYKSLFYDNSSIMLLIDPENGSIVDANKAAIDFYGYSHAEITSLKISEINILSKDEVKTEILNAKTGRRKYFIFKHKLATGIIKHVEVYSVEVVVEGKPLLYSIVHDISNKVVAENELLKLSMAVQQSPAAITITDKNGNIEYTNPKFTELTGYSLEDAVGQNPRILKSGEQPDEIYKELWETISADTVWRGEFHNKKKNGELFWESASVSPIVNENGKITNYIKVAEDITDKKRSEQIQNIIHQISNAVIISEDLEEFILFVRNELGKIIDTSNFYIALYNKQTDTISLPFHKDEKDKIDSFPAGKTLTKYVIKTKKSLLATKAVKDKLAKSGEVKLLGADSKVWLGVPLFIKGEVYGLIAVQNYENEDAYDKSDLHLLEIISHQISISLERKKANEELIIAKEKAESSAANVTAIIEGTENSIWAFDRNYDLLYVNYEFRQEYKLAFGVELSIGTNLVKALPEALQPFWKPRYDRVLSGEQYTIEDAVPTNRGMEYIEVSFNPILKNGEVIGGSCIGSNITEKKFAELELIRAKEKAEESDRLKTAFLNNMSHEIRTPLNGIQGFLGLLQEPELDDAHKNEYIEIVNKSSERLINTVSDIIDISKIEAGQMKLTIKEVSINNLLRELNDFFNYQAEEKGLILSLLPTLADGKDIILTDNHKLNGILTNLIKNAIKFTEKGIITFGYLLKNDNLEFYVKDTGIGVPQDRQEAIFNRFEQADIEDTRVYEGSGLGLAISKSYVEMLGGKLWMKSKEGEGTKFMFSIPYKTKVKKQLSQPEQQHATNDKTNLNNLTVLIAEDEAVNTQFFEALFKNTFHRIIYAETGQQTIDACKSNPEIDMILMDIKMPGMSGYTATREIRKFNKDVIIIAQTAYGLSDDRQKAIKAGCDDYISKPINKELLFEKIMHHVGK